MGTFASDLLARAAKLSDKPARRESTAAARTVGKTNAWPDAVEAILIKLYKKGYPNKDIAPIVGRTANAVGIKINRLRAAGKLGDRGDK